MQSLLSHLQIEYFVVQMFLNALNYLTNYTTQQSKPTYLPPDGNVLASSSPPTSLLHT